MAATKQGSAPKRGPPQGARAWAARLKALPPAQWWRGLPPLAQDLSLVLGLGALIFIPFLGSVGLWDPWEPHYAEVARTMIARGDYVHPYWERAYFFSKPVLSFWMMAAGMLSVGALDGPAGALSEYTEWAVRLPFAFAALGGLAGAYLGAARAWGRRAGLFAAFALATMPFYFLIARQAMTDMPFVATASGALCAFMVAVFSADGRDEHDPSPGWLYLFYFLAGLATLAKGVLGVALPGAVILAWVVLDRRWALLPRLRIPSGALVTAATAGPWYGAMLAFNGKDDEFRTFYERFFLHDHFARLGAGVHTTTPDTTFTYFIEQVGFGVFPWVVALPGALWLLSRVPAQAAERDRSQSATLFVGGWLLVLFLLFSLSATKFHHYGLPMVVPVALLSGAFLARLSREGLGPHYGALLLGFVLFVVLAQNLVISPKHLSDLFVYKYDRPYPHREVDPRAIFGALFGLGGAGLFLSWLRQWGRGALGALGAVALAFALYVSWAHWPALSVHWTQRDLFWTYYQDRPAQAPIGAYLMNWRGETFYSQNQVRQIKNAGDLRAFLAGHPTAYLIVEQGRYSGLQSTIGREWQLKVVHRANHKYYLVEAAPL